MDLQSSKRQLRYSSKPSNRFCHGVWTTLGTPSEYLHLFNSSHLKSCTSSAPSTRTSPFMDLAETSRIILGVLHGVLISIGWTQKFFLHMNCRETTSICSSPAFRAVEWPCTKLHQLVAVLSRVFYWTLIYDNLSTGSSNRPPLYVEGSLAVPVEYFGRWVLQLKRKIVNEQTVCIYQAPFFAMRMSNDACYTKNELELHRAEEIAANAHLFGHNNVKFHETGVRMNLRDFPDTRFGR